MKTLIQVGGIDEKLSEVVADNIIRILEAARGDAITMYALEAFTNSTKAEHITIQHCHLTEKEVKIYELPEEGEGK